MMNYIKWTKESLCQTINQKVDKSESGFEQYVLPHEITDEAIRLFQSTWDHYAHDVAQQQKELRKFYQIVVGGF